MKAGHPLDKLRVHVRLSLKPERPRIFLAQRVASGFDGARSLQEAIAQGGNPCGLRALRCDRYRPGSEPLHPPRTGAFSLSFPGRVEVEN